jgi:hypothetical protein
MLRRLILALIWFAATTSSPIAAKSPQDLDKLQISQSPSRSQWLTFHQWPEAERLAFWQSQVKSGIKLSDWAWEWRVAWVRQCKSLEDTPCGTILEQGLSDPAMVVRAESASHLGQIYAGSGRQDVLNQLQNAYGLKDNVRRGKPLFVQKRILFAMGQIAGGDETKLEQAKILSASHPSLLKYWNKLAKSQQSAKQDLALDDKGPKDKG